MFAELTRLNLTSGRSDLRYTQRDANDFGEDLVI